METLVSSWSNTAPPLPKSYIFPSEKRPGQITFPPDKTISVIDLAHDHHDPTSTIEQILKASQDYGFFQVINHGACKELMDNTMKVVEEFHAMPAKDKERECSKDQNKRSCRLYSSSENFLTGELHYWRDALENPCHPLEEHMQFWPQNPIRYREVVAKYAVEVRKLAHKILELIIQGLGLSPGYFSSELSENPVVLINHYPPCPEPSLLGIGKTP